MYYLYTISISIVRMEIYVFKEEEDHILSGKYFSCVLFIYIYIHTFFYIYTLSLCTFVYIYTLSLCTFVYIYIYRIYIYIFSKISKKTIL